MKSKNLTIWIVISLFSGIIVGYVLHSINNIDLIFCYEKNISVVTDLFLRLIKMVIAPLIMSTLIVGIARMGDAKTFGRVFFKTLLLFSIASFISITIGLIIVNVLKPGIGINFIPNKNLMTNIIQPRVFSFQNFIVHSIPTSIVKAMSDNEILQIVVFSIFMGSSLSAVGKKSELIIKILDLVIFSMLKMINYIMFFAPITVFSAISSIISKYGLNILVSTSIFMGEFYFTLLFLWVVLIISSSVLLGPCVFRLIKKIIDPILLAFTTSSSETAFPGTLEKLKQFGVSNKIANFVLPIGYSFNLVGSMAYCSFAVIFIGQACNINLNMSEQISMLLILMLTSKGMAGVPRSSLVLIAATLAQFNIPESGLVLLVGVDPFLDMGRSATNVMSNAIGAALVGRWEGEHYGKGCRGTHLLH